MDRKNRKGWARTWVCGCNQLAVTGWACSGQCRLRLAPSPAQKGMHSTGGSAQAALRGRGSVARRCARRRPPHPSTPPSASAPPACPRTLSSLQPRPARGWAACSVRMHGQGRRRACPAPAHPTQPAEPTHTELHCCTCYRRRDQIPKCNGDSRGSQQSARRSGGMLRESGTPSLHSDRWACGRVGGALSGAVQHSRRSGGGYLGIMEGNADHRPLRSDAPSWHGGRQNWLLMQPSSPGRHALPVRQAGGHGCGVTRPAGSACCKPSLSMHRLTVLATGAVAAGTPEGGWVIFVDDEPAGPTGFGWGVGWVDLLAVGCIMEGGSEG